jgi:transposase
LPAYSQNPTPGHSHAFLIGVIGSSSGPGETDFDGRISKIGDASVRTVLYEAGNSILIKPLTGCTALKSWAMKLARRSGIKKAKVAPARKSPSSRIGCWSMARASAMSRAGCG